MDWVFSLHFPHWEQQHTSYFSIEYFQHRKILLVIKLVSSILSTFSASFSWLREPSELPVWFIRLLKSNSFIQLFIQQIFSVTY